MTQELSLDYIINSHKLVIGKHSNRMKYKNLSRLQMEEKGWSVILLTPPTSLVIKRNSSYNNEIPFFLRRATN